MQALVDAGAYSSAITPVLLKFFRHKDPSTISDETQVCFRTKFSIGQKSSTLGSVVLTSDLRQQLFSEKFLLLQSMHRPNVRLHVFRKSETNINPANGTLSFSDMTLRLSQTAHLQVTAEKSLTLKTFCLRMQQKTVASRFSKNSQMIFNVSEFSKGHMHSR